MDTSLLLAIHNDVKDLVTRVDKIEKTMVTKTELEAVKKNMATKQDIKNVNKKIKTLDAKVDKLKQDLDETKVKNKLK